MTQSFADRKKDWQKRDFAIEYISWNSEHVLRAAWSAQMAIPIDNENFGRYTDKKQIIRFGRKRQQRECSMCSAGTRSQCARSGMIWCVDCQIQK